MDLVWAKPNNENGRPARPANEVFHLEDRYTGESLGSKLARMREKLVKVGSPGMVVSQLDEIAWLFNLRGSDIPYNPVCPLPITSLLPITC